MAEEEQVQQEKPIEDMSLEELDALQNTQDTENTEAVTEEADAEGIPIQSGEGNPAQDEESTAPEVTLESLAKEMEGLQKLQARSQTELGNTRSENLRLQQELANTQAQLKTQEPNQASDVDIYADPNTFVDQRADAVLERKLQQQQLEQIRQQQTLNNTKNFINSISPDFEKNVNEVGDIVKDLIKDVIPNADESIEGFKQNPYVNTDPLVSVLGNELVKLKRQLADSQQGKGDLINKIKKAGTSRSTINGRGSNSSTNGADQKPVLTDEQIERMSPEELDEVYASLTNGG